MDEDLSQERAEAVERGSQLVTAWFHAEESGDTELRADALGDVMADIFGGDVDAEHRPDVIATAMLASFLASCVAGAMIAVLDDAGAKDRDARNRIMQNAMRKFQERYGRDAL